MPTALYRRLIVAYTLHIEKGFLGRLGVHKLHNGLSIVCEKISDKECGIIIYVNDHADELSNGKQRKKEYKIAFKSNYLINGLYCVFLPDFPFAEFEYHYYVGNEFITDAYACMVDTSAKFGDVSSKKKIAKSRYCQDDYDWEDDILPETPFCNTILYKLHVRGFSKHSSSEVPAKGTFLGLKEKIPYIKELGITAIETMPIFEFQDVIYNPSYSEIDESLLPFLDEGKQVWKTKTNYWGYTDGYYFAPKRSFASSNRPDTELKDLIKALHKDNIEFIPDFYFPPHIGQGFILEVCRYWVKEYHVDGFKLMGCNLPVQLLATDPYLKHTKLIFEALDGISLKKNSSYKNIAVMSKGFLYDIRKYLKGDEDMLHAVATHFRANPDDCAIINEITSYQGFTLADLVSYDRKHNELNGEENRDGSDYNYSWNCGAEGKTRKKAILSLREQQSKNALLMLLTAQGTPVLLAGDEFGNSADGNNNPYCQDNAISWLNWKINAYGNELLRFTKELIAYRKAHPILHKEDALRQSDYISAGYPDVSYHCEQAWYAAFENYNRHMGIMYCGKYAKVDRKNDDNFIYIAYNTHWIDHEFALPKLSDELVWELNLSTCQDSKVTMHKSGDDGHGDSIELPPRSMAIVMGIKKTEMKKDESISTSKDSINA